MKLEKRNTTTDAERTGNTLSGYAILYDQESRSIYEFGREFTERIAKGAFDESMESNKDDIKLYFNHDASMPLARTRNGSLRLVSDDKGLRFEADLPDTTLANDVKELLRTGTLSGEMSFGFYVRDEVWSKDKKDRTITKGDLVEISIVVDAAYPQTHSQLRSVLTDINNKRINSIRRRHTHG
jgi:HK97 family phage prohead protease